MIEDWAAIFKTEWQPVPRWILVAWATFYAVFLSYVFHSHGGFLFIDLANLVVHEGGHLLFGWFGPTLGLWGGTLLQWLVPFVLATYFLVQRQKSAFVFCTFFFFENWLYTATYMADARAMVLPLVTAVGDSDYIEHDWNAIFSSLGVLKYDTTMAGVVRFLGWCGMIAVVTWFVWSARRKTVEGRKEEHAVPRTSTEQQSCQYAHQKQKTLREQFLVWCLSYVNKSASFGV
jgi:hypothetical protein